MKNALLFFLILFSACNSTPKKVTRVFIVPDNPKLKPNSNNEEDIIRHPYYLSLNLIIDNNERIFFYRQKTKPVYCTTGMTLDAPPDFINLQPDEMFEIPIEDLIQFLKLNIQYLDNSDRTICIASSSDTIANTEITNLFMFMDNQMNNLRYTLRQITQEEKMVLAYKKSGKKYSSNEIKWDSTRIQFSPKVLPTKKFIPSK